ncbi:helix-turn-helix transcriptional regulator [Calidifontibacillus oryziterrae]|uniref:helix-turn-helix transcriptional regulator n=1 Tax=Calidifontibacillus oryziterrae TaxID=1191699 RepID=UPI000303B122|nr:AraC family transcriptional regulator [Calidifontibacillus oryziterrae]
MKSSINPSVIRQFLDSRIEHKRDNFIHPPFELEQQLLDAVSLGNQKLAEETLKKINQLERAILANNPIRCRKNALIAICTLFTRAIIKGGVYPEMAFVLSDANIMEIEKIDHLEELDQFEYEMLRHFIQTLNEEKNTQNYSHPIKLAISYIYDNIINDLSLDIISKHVYVHPNYLSNRFKKEVGSTVTDFITKKRIEESKYFLVHTNTSISHIAILFKFCNQSYYTSLFKQHTGMTPREFRRLKQTI